MRNEQKRWGARSELSFIISLVKRSGIYALGSMASPLISLVLAPFLTRYLSHVEYGALAVLNVAIALISGVTQLGLIAAFSRAYNSDYESQQDRLGVVSASVSLLLLVSIPAAIAMMIAAAWSAELLLNSPSFSSSVRLAALVVLLQNLTVPGFSWLRAEKRAALSSVLSIANLLIALGANIILVGVLHMGINGSLIATGGGYAVVAVCTLPVILLRVGLGGGLRPRFDIMRNLLLFGGPFVFSIVSTWVLQLSDRYLLSYFGSLAQTAGYTVAYSLGGVLASVLIGPFIAAWHPTMYAIAKKEVTEAVYVYRLVFRLYSIISLFATFALSLLSVAVLDALFPPSYHSVAPIIPIIALSTMFFGVAYVLSVGVYIQRKSVFIPILTTLSALVNVGLNIILIPLYGPMGAAVSTLLAYVLLALNAYVVNQRIYAIPFEIGIFMFGLFVGVALYIGSSLLAHAQGKYMGWGISLAALTLYAGYLALLGMLLARRDKKAYRHTEEVLIS